MNIFTFSIKIFLLQSNENESHPRQGEQSDSMEQLLFEAVSPSQIANTKWQTCYCKTKESLGQHNGKNIYCI